MSEVLAEHSYLADDGLATSLFLALRMGRPLFLEGEAGAGKTEVAIVLARWTGGELVRLQCYDGIDVSQAVYEWDYARQLLHLRALESAEASSREPSDVEHSLYSEEYLVRRPLLRAIAATSSEGPVPVLLIDEIDRADDEFEAYLLEILSDFSVTIPELGTFRAERPPIVIVTSNRTRDVHDALKRRCLYQWVDHPSFEREVAIVRLRVPEASESLAREVAAVTAELRQRGLYKPPGVAESIDWAQALSVLGSTHLDERTVERTLGTVIKYREDAERVRAAGVAELVSDALRSIA
jgi:MoxR-like ATPase